MHFSTSNTGLVFGVLSSLIWSCAAAPAPPDVDTPPIMTAPFPTAKPTLPLTCFEKDKPTCYTYTKTTAPKACPTYSCPDLTGIACPAVIRVTTLEVPCSTDCCPTTSTKYTTTSSCPTCPKGCVIPTWTSTVTTGCTATATVKPTTTKVTKTVFFSTKKTGRPVETATGTLTAFPTPTPAMPTVILTVVR